MLEVAYALALELRQHGLAGRIRKEMRLEIGRKDRRAGEGCRSSNGSYLDGWYDPDGGLLNITAQELDRLHQRSRIFA